MQNPNPDLYRTLEQKYPSWCKNGAFVVYRKLQQDVHGFWDMNLQQASVINTDRSLNLSQEQLHSLAGDLAAKCIGRWWDGTPLIFDGPLTGLHYPPEITDEAHKGRVMDSKASAAALDGLKNGFQYAENEAAWPVVPEAKSGPIAPPDMHRYPADPNGAACPFGAHIRKMQPRDEFTDIGSNIQTLKHRVIRRGNNYGERVKNIFQLPAPDQERGLSLLMYVASIEDQFEFLQRHWANSFSRPKSSGDDMVIGLPHGRDKTLPVQISSPVSTSVTLTSSEDFVMARGMGYFLLPSITALCDVISSTEDEETIFLSPPANQNDFKNFFSYKLWDWTVRYLFWQSIWASDNTTVWGGQIVVPSFADMTAAGIAYRLPDTKELARCSYENFQNHPSYLQFRSTDDLYAMANSAGMDGPVEAKIAWQGFPKRLLDLYENSDVNPYEIADSLGWPSADVKSVNYASTPKARQHDEYCEWYSYRNQAGKITRIDITCEAPEYWTFLFKNEPDTAVEIYRKYISEEVKKEDLQNPDGTYNLYNVWNTEKGAMHLNCPPNSLQAEIYIAAEVSTFWGCCSNSLEEPKEGKKLCKPYTDGGDLMLCGQYGLSTRASDPTIGANVNSLIRDGNIVSLQKPVALYLENLDTTGWMNNEKEPFSDDEINQIVSYERGTQDPIARNLRIKVEIPDSWGYTLGDCFIGGDRIEWAGQLVDSSVTVFLVGAAVPGSQFLSPSPEKYAIVPCKGKWKYTTTETVGPIPRLNPLYPAPEHPVEGISDQKRVDDLKQAS